MHRRCPPIHRINFESQAEAVAHDEIVKLVDRMLILQKERQAIRPEDDRDIVRNIDRKIKEVDADINKKVYILYGLSDEEQRVVEDSLSKA